MRAAEGDLTLASSVSPLTPSTPSSTRAQSAPTASEGAARRPGLEGASVKTLGAPDLRAAVCSLADTTGGWEEPGQSSAAACRNKNSCRRWWKNRLSWRSLSSTRSDRNELLLTSCASPTSGSSVEAGGHLVIITSYFFFLFFVSLSSFFLLFFFLTRTSSIHRLQRCLGRQTVISSPWPSCSCGECKK